MLNATQLHEQAFMVGCHAGTQDLQISVMPVELRILRVCVCVRVYVCVCACVCVCVCVCV